MPHAYAFSSTSGVISMSALSRLAIEASVPFCGWLERPFRTSDRAAPRRRHENRDDLSGSFKATPRQRQGRMAEPKCRGRVSHARRIRDSINRSKLTFVNGSVRQGFGNHIGAKLQKSRTSSRAYAFY